jgi:hypothetical protein
VWWPDGTVEVDAAGLAATPGPGATGLEAVPGLEVVPGVELAIRLAATDLGRLDGDGLLTAIGAWRRLGSWAKAGEVEAVAAFLDRRTRDRPGIGPLESAVSELQLELTLTAVGAGRLLELACPLSDRVPATLEALRCGAIDEAKARVIARAVDGVLDARAAGAVERSVLPKAPTQTTGQLRHSVERAVIQADPQAAERRRRRAEAGRRVEIRSTDAHTADLCGRDLPADQALAADQRITALAKALKHDGAPASLTFLRAQVFLTLLLGTGPTPTWPPVKDLPDQPVDETPQDLDDAPSHTDPRANLRHREDAYAPTATARGSGHSGGPDDPCAGRSTTDPADPADPAGCAGGANIRTGTGGGPTATVHVIVPIDTLRGISDQPAEVPGYGAVPASVARAIAATATGRPWCYSITDHTGRAVRHGHANAPARDDYRQLLTDLTAELNATTRADDNKTGHPPDVDHHPAATGPPRAGRIRDANHPAAAGYLPDFDHLSAAGHSPAAGRVRDADRPSAAGHLPAAGRVRDADYPPAAGHCRDADHPPGADRPPAAGHVRDAAGLSGTEHDPQGTYRPSAALRHLIEIRDGTCRFPACRRPAQHCDLDHTRPYDDGGTTCACNLAPLCRRHHRLKQTQGWTLTQPRPGHLTWTTPSGRKYVISPDPYPIASADDPIWTTPSGRKLL